MRKIIFFLHISLDDYVAGANGEMNWIRLPEALFDFVGMLTKEADAALYGRKTYEMMQSYWPTAAENPNASKHDKEHAEWYNRVSKIVISKTMENEKLEKTTIIGEKIAENLRKIKQQEGKNILIFGSPSVVQTLLNEDLIDEFWLSVNPVILGDGKALFENITKTLKLDLLDSKTFPEKLVLLHYGIVQ